LPRQALSPKWDAGGVCFTSEGARSPTGRERTPTGEVGKMRRTILLVAAVSMVLALAGTTVVVQVPAASADTGCVTRAEYRRVDVGMSQVRVRQIFGTRGQLSDRQGSEETYVYDGCPTYVSVWVWYRDNKVTDKWWARGE
jgi:hypothetical protein